MYIGHYNQIIFLTSKDLNPANKAELPVLVAAVYFEPPSKEIFFKFFYYITTRSRNLIFL